MKLYTLILFTLMFSLQVIGQEKILGKKAGKNITYILLDAPHLGKIHYRNEKNKLYNKKVIPQKKYESPQFSTLPLFEKGKEPFDDFYRILAKSLTRQKIEDIQNEHNFIILYFDYPGTLLEMEILVDRSSKLTVEIESIEARLKENLKVRIINKFLEGSNYVPLSFEIDPKRILASKRE